MTLAPDTSKKEPSNQPRTQRWFLSSRVMLIALLPIIALVLLMSEHLEVSWAETWQAIQSSSPLWYFAAIAAHYCSFIFRATRWKILLQNAARTSATQLKSPSVIYCINAILIGLFINCVTWFRAGDAYRAYIYAEDTKSSFPRSMGTIVSDRVVDMAAVFILMAVSMALLYTQGKVRPPLILIVASGILMFVVIISLATMALFRNWITIHLPSRARGIYDRFHAGTLESLDRTPLIFLLGLCSWLCEALRLLFVIQALNLSVTLGLILFVPMANGLLSAIPLTPGGLGIVETGISGLLNLELTMELALAVALVDRSISYASVIITGGFAFILRQSGITNRVHSGYKTRSD
jgi:uncharacterized protein (TIRG00374 family)